MRPSTNELRYAWSQITTTRGWLFAGASCAVGLAFFGVATYLTFYASDDIARAYSPLARGLGVACISSPVLALILQAYQRESLRQETTYTIRSVFAQQSEEVRSIVEVAGIENAFDKIDNGAIIPLLESAKRGDEVRMLNTWIPDAPNYAKALQKAQENGAIIRVLLCDPSSQAAVQRARDIGLSPSSVPEHVQGTVNELVRRLEVCESEEPLDAKSRAAGMAQIRYYRNVPAVPLYGSGRHLFTGAFWSHQQAIAGTCVQISPSGHFAEDLIDHFENLWEDSLSSPSVERFESADETAGYQHFYYLSTLKDESPVWRHMDVDVRGLIGSGRQCTCAFVMEEGGKEVAYSFRVERPRNQIVITMVGASEGVSDHNVVAFPISDGLVEQEVLAGIASHFDWRRRPAVDPALLLTEAGNSKFLARHDIDILECGEAVPTDAWDDLFELWNAEQTLGRSFRQILVQK